MRAKSILVLQGGGALGAYECGVYQTLAPQLENLAVVAGTSIGAINAGIIARHYRSADRGAGFLRRFWLDQLAHPSRSFPDVPFTGTLSHKERWDAVWTSLMYGHPRLFVPRSPGWVGWNLLPPIFWSDTYFYDTAPMHETLSRPGCFGMYGGDSEKPRLLVTAVDVQAGRMKMFDSAHHAVTAAHLVASGSLPPMFRGTEIDGRTYWDGGVWSNTPLPEALTALQKSGSRESEYKVYVVDVFPRRGTMPQNNWQVWHRIAELTYADRTDYDRRACHWVNEYLDLVRLLQAYGDELPAALRDEIQRRHTRLSCHTRFHLDITVIRREAYPDEEAEQISREIDFSPRRIQELVDQGRRDADRELSKVLQDHTAPEYAGRNRPGAVVR